MRRLIALCLVLLLVATVGSAVMAQDEGADVLVIANYGDWWASFEGATIDPFLVNFCGISLHGERQISPLVMSPNGDFVAYLTYPLAVTEVMEASGGIGGPVANQVRLCNGIDSVDISVPSQPADFVFDMQANIYYNNSAPTWSPDNTHLAWTAWRFPQDDFVLAIYSVATGETTYIEGQIPPQYGVPTGLPTYWGQSGIAVISYTYDATTQTEKGSVLLFDIEGALLTEHVLSTYAAEYLWVDDNGVEKLALIYPDAQVDLWDPSTKTVAPLSGRLEYFTPETPAQTYRLTFEYIAYNETTWTVWSNDGSLIAELPFIGTPASQRLAMAPSTQSIAYISDNVAWMWSNGTTTSVLIPTDAEGLDFNASLIWAPMRWRVWS